MYTMKLKFQLVLLATIKTLLVDTVKIQQRIVNREGIHCTGPNLFQHYCESFELIPKLQQ